MLGHALRARVRPVCGAKGVVHVHVHMLGQLRGARKRRVLQDVRPLRGAEACHQTSRPSRSPPINAWRLVAGTPLDQNAGQAAGHGPPLPPSPSQSTPAWQTRGHSSFPPCKTSRSPAAGPATQCVVHAAIKSPGSDNVHAGQGLPPSSRTVVTHSAVAASPRGKARNTKGHRHHCHLAKQPVKPDLAVLEGRDHALHLWPNGIVGFQHFDAQQLGQARHHRVQPELVLGPRFWSALCACERGLGWAGLLGWLLGGWRGRTGRGDEGTGAQVATASSREPLPARRRHGQCRAAFQT